MLKHYFVNLLSHSLSPLILLRITIPILILFTLCLQQVSPLRELVVAQIEAVHEETQQVFPSLEYCVTQHDLCLTSLFALVLRDHLCS